MAYRSQTPQFSSFNPSARKQNAGGEGPNAPRQGNGQTHGTGNANRRQVYIPLISRLKTAPIDRKQGPGPRCNRGNVKWNASAGLRQTPTWRGARGQYAYPPPEYSSKGSLIPTSGPGQGQNNHYPKNSNNRYKKGVSPRNNPIPAAPRGLDFVSTLPLFCLALETNTL